MRLIIISDIHGNSDRLQKAIAPYKADQETLFLLPGDILNPGPRNPLTEGYNPSKVVEILTEYSSRIIAVRGNCDGEVDQMLLPFPVLNDYASLFVWNKRVILTHGHLFSSLKELPFEAPDILISGHTHIPAAEKIDGKYRINSGSITLPKGDEFPASYGVLEKERFQLFNLDHQLLKEWKLS